MGIESVLGAVAGPVIGGLLGGGGGGGGSSQSGTQTVSNRVELDPRMHDILFGTGRGLRPGTAPIYQQTQPTMSAMPATPYAMDGLDGGMANWYARQQNLGQAQGQTPGQTLANPESDYTNDSGLLGKVTGLLDRPQNPGMSRFGSTADQYLGANGQQDLNNMRASANALMGGGLFPHQISQTQVGDVPGMQAAKVNAPGQNNLGLAPAYQNMIYGNPAENPYLTGAIQKGISQSSNAFGNMLQDATRNLTQSILPGIRSGARVSGSYGGDREGIATGQALDGFNQQIGRTLSQVGQNNTDAAVGAQAGQFDAGQNRALSALTGLGGQQYSTALADAGFQQGANQTNYGGDLQTAMHNADLQQQQRIANMDSKFRTDQLNTNRTQAGLSANSGLLGQAYGFGTNQDAYGGQKVGQVAGLLSPFTGLGATGTTNTPLYQNQGAGILGGALMGQQIGKGLFGSSGGNLAGMNSGWLSSNPGMSYGDLLSAF